MTGSNKLKRSGAPVFWGIQRKGKGRFAVNPSPGPHPKLLGIPLRVLIRDVLKLTKTSKEAQIAIVNGSVTVDGVVRRDPNFPVGLMDVVEMLSLGKIFRLLPTKARTLYPIEVPESEKGFKLCRVKNKVTVPGGSIQYGLHDGRSILAGPEVSIKVGDSALIEVPKQKIVKHVALKKGSLVLITGGERQGEVGKLGEIKSGSVSRPPMASVSIDESTVEIPAKLVIAVGEEAPLVSVAVK